MADNLYDPVLGGARLSEKECDTCIFKPDSPFRTGESKLRDGRFKQFVADAVEQDSYIICHSTIGGKEAMCRGFYDRFSTNTMRVLTRLGVVEVPCPKDLNTGGS